jgi:gluconate 2-dehydrogenase gamma chain
MNTNLCSSRADFEEMNVNDSEANDSEQKVGISRRDFLKVATVTVAATAVGCRPVGPERQWQTRDTVLARVPQSVQYPEVPFTPAAIPSPGPLRFFTPHEARTVEAFTARLLPGTPEDPGAREAGVVYYIDGLLAHQDGFAEPIYRQPPYAEAYDGDTPPNEQEGAFPVIWVPADEIERYGYQSIYTPRDVFRIAVVGLDRFANERFDSNFVDLAEDQQDALIEAMVEGEDNGFEPLTGEAVFHTLRRYTSEGMFSDPVYGGNRGYAGWRLVGYPGAQRAYTAEDILVEGRAATRPTWGISDLPHFHPGAPEGPNTVLPVRGSEEHRHER